MFKKLVIAVSLALAAPALGGCITDTLNSASINPQAVQTSESAIDLAISAATAYVALPVCSKKVAAPCRTIAGHRALKKDIAAVQVARDNIQTLLKANNGGSIPLANYQTLQSAYNTLTSDVSIYAGK
jgi:hypothetical protein